MAEAMRPTIRRALLLFALAMLMVSAFGCGGPEAGDEPTTKPDAPTASSIPTTVQTLVVDGDTSEEYEAALPSLEAAVAADENDLAALQDLAVAQFQTGRYEEAAATYERMLAIQENAFVRNNYANVLRDWGKTDEAEKQYRKGHRHRSHPDLPLRQPGECAEQAGRYRGRHRSPRVRHQEGLG